MNLIEPEKIKSILIYGSNLEYHLFQFAIHFAEQGLNVWFVSPKQFQKLPFKLDVPEKDVLKLITFLYLTDNQELLKHLNDLHSWHRIPQVIIINRLDQYILPNENISSTAFIAANLLDAGQTCYNKHKQKAYVIAAYHNRDPTFNMIRDLYFKRSLCINENDTSPIETLYK